MVEKYSEGEKIEIIEQVIGEETYGERRERERIEAGNRERERIKKLFTGEKEREEEKGLTIDQRIRGRVPAAFQWIDRVLSGKEEGSQVGFQVVKFLIGSVHEPRKKKRVYEKVREDKESGGIEEALKRLEGVRNESVDEEG